MNFLAVLALAVIVSFGAYLRGYQLGKRAAYREWLEALLDEAPLDFDEMLVRVLEDIRRDAA